MLGRTQLYFDEGGWLCRWIANARSSTKFIAGVPVFNYHMEYDGEEVLVEGETEG